MTRPLTTLWLAVGGVSLAAVTLVGRGAVRAQREARIRVAAFEGLRDRVVELDRLQARVQKWPQRPADTNLAQEISAALSAAGLPSSSLASLAPDNGAAVPGSAELMQLRAGMTLSNVTLPQVGRFLSEWRRRQPSPGPAWTVTAIDLAPEAGGDKAAGGDLPLRAVLNLESIVTKGGEP